MKKYSLCLVLILSFLLVTNFTLKAQTTINSTINANTTWTQSGSPYLMGSSATVAAGVTLTIQPGVVVKFNTAYDEFFVNGIILAQGTLAEPIVFTSIKDDVYGGDSNGDGNATQPKDQDWRSIVVNGAGSQGSMFSYCLFRFGGYYFGDDAALRAQNSAPNIANCTFYKNHKAIMVGGSGAPTISDCTFDGTTEMALSVSLAANPVLSNNTYIANGVNGLGIVTGTYSSASNYTLQKIDTAIFPFDNYVIDNTITLNANVNLTIEPGVVIKFKNQFKIYSFLGVIKAEGTSTEPIIFSSIHDDLFGVDADNNANATLPTDQDWRRLSVQNSQSSFKYCNFRYGGYYFGDEAALWISGSNTSVENCTFYKNNKSIYALSGAAPTVKNCLFQENTLVPISISLSSQPIFENNNFVNNKINGLGIVAITYSGPGDYTLKKIQPGSFPFNSYIIDNSFIVESTVNLNIEPGVIIKSSEQFLNIDIRGTLLAEGTAAEPIIITSIRDDAFGGDSNNDGAATQPSPDDWRRIIVQSDQSKLKYCQFRYGGYYFGDEAALWLNGSDALVENCTFFRTDKAIGLVAGAAPTIRNCLFQETRTVPIAVALSTNILKPVLENNTFLNNAINAVGIIAGTYSTAGTYILGKLVDNISQAGTAYYLEDNLTISAASTLVIEPGVILKIKGTSTGSGIYIDVKGKILAQGSSTDPIVFSSSRDDAYGGDTNNNGNSTSASAGDWYGVLLSNSAGSVFDNCLFRYGGFLNTGTDLYGAIRCLGTSNPLIQNCSFQNNSTGITVGTGAQPTIANCVFTNSARVPVSVYLGASPVFSDITFGNNVVNAVGIEGGNYTTAGNYTLGKLSLAGLDNVPYYLHENLTLGPSVSLTFEPGVILKCYKPSAFNSISIIVQGTVVAQGTPTEPVVFTSVRDDTYGGDANNDGTSSKPYFGDWQGFVLSNDITPSTFSNCLFRYGGYYSYSNTTLFGVIRAIAHSKPQISDCIFAYNSEGVVADDFSAPKVANCNFIDCGWVAVSMALTADPDFSDNNTVDNLTIRAIGLVEGAYSDVGDFLLRKRQFAGVPNIAYFERNWLTLEAGFKWTIEPGITLKFYKTTDEYYRNRVIVRGEIHAEGTLGAPIVFTAYDDDEFGGDIHNNGNAVSAQMGDWLGILLYNSSGSRFNNCKFRYGGYSTQSPQYGVLRIENSAPTVTRCEFSDNNRAVVVAGSSSNVSLDSCNLYKNKTGLRKEAGTVSIHNSNIYNNTDFGVQNTTTVDVDARFNWWGAASGPLHPVKNPAGTGNKVSDYVLFEPWEQQKVTFKNDLGVTIILQPTTRCNLSTQETIKVTLANLGSEVQTGFDLVVSVNGAQVFQENTGSFTLPGLSTGDYTFQQKVNLSALQDYTISVATQLPNDQNVFNDSKSITITNYATINPAGQFANLLPANNDPAVELPVLFSWSPVPNVQSYDLYLWFASDAEPTTPTVPNIETFAYSYTSQLLYGVNYKWRVIARNPCSSLSGPIQQFTTKSLPDLVVNQVIVPTSPFSGQSIEISWETLNQGTINTGAIRWYDAIFLSTDPVLNVNTDVYLGAVYNDIALNPGEGFTQMGQVTLPNGIENQYYIFVVADYYNYLQEFDEQNNTATSSIDIKLAPPPDLQVSSVIAPFNAFSEQFIAMSYTVVNNGTGPTVEGVWKDRIYLSDESVLNPSTAIVLGTFSHSGDLNANQGYTRTENIALPNGVFGKYFIHVRTDLDNKVFEYAYENNNVGHSDTLDITLTPPPDLQVSALTAPASASNREQVTLRWTVTNNGASNAKGSWYDQIYISSSSVLNAQAIKLTSIFQSSRDIAPGSSYSNERLVTIPATINGLYSFFVTTDFFNTIYEFNNEGNNSRRSDQATDILSPDLAVENLSAPSSAFSGQSFDLTWQVSNQGAGQLVSIQRKDKIYLSQNALFNLQQALALDSLIYNGSLLSGQNIGKQKNITLPNGLNGAYFLHLVTDSDNKVFENGSEANNVASIPLNISLAAWPDLQVTSINGVPGNIVAGNIVTLDYTVRNGGIGQIINKVWKDRLYISASDTWIPSAAKPIQDFEIALSLQTNGTYSRNISFALPMLTGGAFAGTCYLYVVADADNSIYEHTSENNNVLRSAAIQVASPPPVDLAVFDLLSPLGDTAQSGQQVNLRWDVRNIGTTTAVWNYPFWYDGLYISQNPTWSADDLFVTDWTEAGPLEAQAIYQDNKTFTIPPGLSGNFYFLLVSDHTGLVIDVNRPNNVRLLNEGNAVYLKKISYPDLSIVDFSVAPVATAGQPLPLSWTVKNTGIGQSLGNAWADKAYLSNDPILDAGDLILSTVKRDGALAPGASYSVNNDAIVPITAQGNYVIWIKADANQTEFEEPSETNNLVSVPINVVVPPPSDLQVNFISHPDSAAVGADLAVEWYSTNTGLNPANGIRQDIVYLSKDDQWDLGDVPLGSKGINGNLPPGGQEKHTMVMQVPGVETGEYYIIVQADALNNILEQNETNNIGVSGTKIRIEVGLLPIGIPKTAQLDNDRGLYHRIEVPDSLAGETMLITMNGDTLQGVNELYLAYDKMPTRSDHDFSATEPFKSAQQLIVPQLKVGDYYLLAAGSTPGGPWQDISLLARILPFELRTVQANKGGNTGSVTVKVSGGKLEAGMEWILSQPGGNTILAGNTYLINSTEAFVTFDLSAAALGVYDLSARKSSGAIAWLYHGFEVVSGSVSGDNAAGGGFVCSIENTGTDELVSIFAQHPPNTRRNRVVAIQIQYANIGNIDLPTPTRFVFSLAGAPLAFEAQDLDKNAQELLLEFTEKNGPPGILRPGASGSITVFTLAIAPLRFFLSE